MYSPDPADQEIYAKIVKLGCTIDRFDCFEDLIL